MPKARLRIEHNVPVPVLKRATKWPQLQAMQAGDSMKIAERDFDSCRFAAMHLAKKTGRKFTIRAQKEGYRIWRIS